MMTNDKEQEFNKEEEMNGKQHSSENADQDQQQAGNEQADGDATNDQETSEEAEAQSDKQAQQSELEKKDQEYKDLHEKYLRLYSEFENFRRRTRKEVEDAKNKGKEDIVGAVLPVLDDFERSLSSMENSGENEELYKGVELIYNKFKNVLKEKGLQEMEAKGQDFDPEYHEAMTKTQAPSEEEKGKVVDEVEKGYFLNDKIVRHAKVVVGE